MSAPKHAENGTLDPNFFRYVLGHYPTGVVVISALDDIGNPVGMVVGSFTSVSLDPALVAYLPSKSSATYQELKKSKHFVVNILGSEHEWLCRRLATKNSSDKWEGISWKPSALGMPIIEDALAWIECEFQQNFDAGDHDIVMGKVVDLDADSNKLPLIFFQGGYGRFTPRSIVSVDQKELMSSVRIGEIARSYLEELGEKLNLEVGLQTALKNELVLVATSAPTSANRSPSRVGDKLPLVAPLGTLSMAWASPENRQLWLNRSKVASENTEINKELQLKLQRVKERGYSVVLEAPNHNELNRLMTPFVESQATPYQHNNLLSVLPQLIDWYEPESLENISEKKIRVLSVPIFGGEDQVLASLQLRELPLGLTLDEVETLVATLVVYSTKISKLL